MLDTYFVLYMYWVMGEEACQLFLPDSDRQNRTGPLSPSFVSPSPETGGGVTRQAMMSVGARHPSGTGRSLGSPWCDHGSQSRERPFTTTTAPTQRERPERFLPSLSVPIWNRAVVCTAGWFYGCAGSPYRGLSVVSTAAGRRRRATSPRLTTKTCGRQARSVLPCPADVLFPGR